MTYAPTHLRVDLRRAPYGITDNPTLAWRLPTGTVQQTAYRLRLHHGTETVTDSGWIASAACTGLTFPQSFLPIEPGTLYAFSVAVRTATSPPFPNHALSRPHLVYLTGSGRRFDAARTAPLPLCAHAFS